MLGEKKRSKVHPDDAVDRASTPNEESWADSGDNVTFSILVGVGLEVNCKFPYNDPQSTNLRGAGIETSTRTAHPSSVGPEITTGSFTVTGSCEANPNPTLYIILAQLLLHT